MEDKARQDGERSRLKLNTIQVAAGALAAISSAVAASYLSVGGTIIGAAVGSVVTTTAGAVYSHYLERTQVRLRDAVTPVLDRTGLARVVIAEEPSRADAGNPGAPDLAQPAVSDKAAVTEDAVGQGPTGQGPTGQGTTGPGPRREISWRRLAPLGGMAVLIFAIALGAISLFETGTGRPVSATVRGQDDAGATTSLGAVVKGDSAKDERQDQKQDREQEQGNTPSGEPSTGSTGPTGDTGSPEPGQDQSASPDPGESAPVSPEQPEPGGDGQPTGESGPDTPSTQGAGQDAGTAPTP